MKTIGIQTIVACLFLTACGEKIDSPIKQEALSHESKPSLPRIIEDNQEEIATYHRLKPEAETLLASVQEEMKKNAKILDKYRKEGLSPDVPAHGRKLAELMNQAESKLGNPITSPLGQCSKMAAMADSYWSESLMGNHPDVLAVSKKSYEDSVKDCKSDLESPPKPTITVELSSDAAAPHQDCLLVISPEPSKTQILTCPEEARKHIQAS